MNRASLINYKLARILRNRWKIISCCYRMEILRCASCIAAWHVCELAGQGSVAASYAHAIHAKVLVGRRELADSPHSLPISVYFSKIFKKLVDGF